MTRKRICIVGGVAGGASAATRLRRLDESAEIVVLERGPYVSFANCGLPYYVGDVITDEDSLLVATPKLFRDRYAIDVRPLHEVLEVKPKEKTLRIRLVETGEEQECGYDDLILAPGAQPVRPPIPGIDLPGIFAVRTVPDARMVRAWIQDGDSKRAVVVGGGFIGCEMAENLRHRGMDVTIIELADQLMPPLDPELSVTVRQRFEENGVQVVLGDSVAAFHQGEKSIRVQTGSGLELDADLVILAIGIAPESKLAKEAGLRLGPRGHIQVDPQMRTSEPHIFAVGDAVQVLDAVRGIEIAIPLAGPANRQGRIAADAICGRDTEFRGVQGTAVCGIFDLTVAMTGSCEKSLRAGGDTDYEVAYLHPGHHVGYFPGARPMHIKLIFRPRDGQVLGAQAVGDKGVARRIDVIAAFVQKGGTVFDLEEAELCYAPQYGAAKDPVNMAGMIAANVLRGDLRIVSWKDAGPATLADELGAFLLDVRSAAEVGDKPLMPGMRNIPIEDIRARMDEIPTDRPVWVTCAVGQRAYNACRILSQHGRDVALLSGGAKTLAAHRSAGVVPA